MPHLENYDETGNRQRVERLRERGVDVWGPERVYVAADVDLESIEPGASIYQATLSGVGLRIGRGSRIGISGHARVADCQIGRNVELGAGSYEGATLLDGAVVRGCAEIRPGTLLEEYVDAAHTVGFKNTLLTATVVTGSLINYCDLFMSGGTLRTEHSEVGSGVVHFNFDPRGDKYGSLIGDVRGVLLRSAPIFIGGQCGLVGPVHVDFGAVVAAGSRVRGDVGPGVVHFENSENRQLVDFDPEIYAGLKRKFLTTAKLIGTLRALDAWYEHVRLPFADDYQKPLYRSAQQQARAHIIERVKRLEKIVAKLERSIAKSSRLSDPRFKKFHSEHRRLIDCPITALLCDDPTTVAPPAGFLKQYEQARKSLPHVEAVVKVDEPSARAAAEWLHPIAQQPVERLSAVFG